MWVKTDKKESYEAGGFIISWYSNLAPKMGIKADYGNYRTTTYGG